MGNHIKITEIHSNEKKTLGFCLILKKNDVVVFMYKYLYSLQGKKMESITLKHEVMQCKIDNFVME